MKSSFSRSFFTAATILLLALSVLGAAFQLQVNKYMEDSTVAGLQQDASIIANLELKTDFSCLPEGKLVELKSVSSFVDDLANVRHNRRAPFVGDSAFAHKGGMHVNAVQKDPRTFEHVPPEAVGWSAVSGGVPPRG